MGFQINRDVYSLKLRNVVGDLVGHVLSSLNVKRATKFLSPGMVVKATYVGKPGGRARAHHVKVTIGSPNYAEREFIKQCKKAGEPFPVKKVQLKFVKGKTSK